MTTSPFQIPFERRLGTDMITRNLKHPNAKDILIKAIIGVDGNVYRNESIEWVEDTQSNVLYCILAYYKFKALPVLVIFCINGATEHRFNNVYHDVLISMLVNLQTNWRLWKRHVEMSFARHKSIVTDPSRSENV
ncbi:hypothetical protein BY458DRAFT_491821 [Sporodiniella umbellata]|nr:hypothetical protein BY458DRAFT_491821 [Sporodiniella umbellata]